MASTVPVCQITSAGLAAAKAGPQRFHHFGGGAARLHVGRHLDRDARQLFGKRALQPRRIGIFGAVRPRQKTRSRRRPPGCRAAWRRARGRHAAAGNRARSVAAATRHSAGCSASRQRRRRPAPAMPASMQHAPRHASPPAKPGLAAGGRGPGPRRSTRLYHETKAATATIMTMPETLTMIVHQQPVGHFGEDEMAGKGQEHAEAEGFQRMLPAHDRRPEAPAISTPASRAARTTP